MIDISFDTYKHLTLLRSDEGTSYDDVIRRLLKLPPIKASASPRSKAWSYKGVSLPEGTDLRANYNGALHTAKIEGGKWVQDGETYISPSGAAFAVTQYGVNGWYFWEAKLPGEDRWKQLNSLRN